MVDIIQDPVTRQTGAVVTTAERCQLKQKDYAVEGHHTVANLNYQ
jgi:hypothetical protein